MSLLSEFPQIGLTPLMGNTMLTIDENVLKGELRKDEPMSRHTSWKTGGNVELYYRPADVNDLGVFLSMLPDSLPVFWVGNGSNLLVRDGGVKGVIISVSGVLDSFNNIDEQTIELGAGMPCVKAARNAAKLGLSGIEFLAGIPGTVGGALAMNAGAYGGEIWQCVKQVETINRKGEIRISERDKFDIAYRSVSIAQDEWFISATVSLDKTDPEVINQAIKKMLRERADAQPLGQLSCGSVFRNPAGDHAARLIESCGLKGHAIGGACVSEKHANFIINTDSATSTDIERLITHVQATVAKRYQIKLTPEVKIIGDMPAEDTKQ